MPLLLLLQPGGVPAGLASGSGVAFDATTDHPAANPTAATGAGAAFNAQAVGSVNANASAAPGTGAASDAGPSVSPAARLASGTGAASSATIKEHEVYPAAAAGTGIARTPAPSIKPKAEIAWPGAIFNSSGFISTLERTAIAYDTTVDRAIAYAGAALGVGAALAPETASVGPTYGEFLPRYEGSSLPVHVLVGSTVAAVSDAPVYDVPRYQGQLSPVFATSKSPSFDATQLQPPTRPWPFYWGRSAAIHVFDALAEDDGEAASPPVGPGGGAEDSTCWPDNNPIEGIPLDDFARSRLLPSAGWNDVWSSLGYSSYGHYPWFTNNNIDGQEKGRFGAGITTLDGGLRFTPRTEFADWPSSAQWEPSLWFNEWYVFLPIDPIDIKVTFNLQLTTGGRWPRPWLDISGAPVTTGREGAQNMNFEMQLHRIETLDGKFRGPLIAAGLEGDYPFAYFEENAGTAESSGVDHGHLRSMIDFGQPAKVDVANGGSFGIIGVIIERHGSTIKVTAGPYVYERQIEGGTVEPTVGELCYTRLDIFMGGRNRSLEEEADQNTNGSGYPATEYKQWFVPNSGFLARISNLRVQSSEPRCIPSFPPYEYILDPDYWNGPDPETAREGSSSIGLPSTTYPSGQVIFRAQIGDPTTTLDRTICLLESAAMVLDWQTRGGVQVWGGELIPWCGRSEELIRQEGTSLFNARQAWDHYGEYLDIRAGRPWSHLIACLTEGRALILGLEYTDLIDAGYACDDFTGGHAIAVFPYQDAAGKILVGDPLCGGFRYVPGAALQAAAEAQGVAFYNDPNQLYFAVSKPWI